MHEAQASRLATAARRLSARAGARSRKRSTGCASPCRREWLPKFRPPAGARRTLQRCRTAARGTHANVSCRCSEEPRFCLMRSSTFFMLVLATLSVAVKPPMAGAAGLAFIQPAGTLWQTPSVLRAVSRSPVGALALAREAHQRRSRRGRRRIQVSLLGLSLPSPSARKAASAPTNASALSLSR